MAIHKGGHDQHNINMPLKKLICLIFASIKWEVLLGISTRVNPTRLGKGIFLGGGGGGVIG